jgi:hypothetical protein
MQYKNWPAFFEAHRTKDNSVTGWCWNNRKGNTKWLPNKPEVAMSVRSQDRQLNNIKCLQVDTLEMSTLFVLVSWEYETCVQFRCYKFFSCDHSNADFVFHFRMHSKTPRLYYVIMITDVLWTMAQRPPPPIVAEGRVRRMICGVVYSHYKNWRMSLVRRWRSVL